MNKRHGMLALIIAAGLSTASSAQGMKGHEGMDQKAVQPAASATARVERDLSNWSW